MKVLTPEQEQAHYDASLKGGVLGGAIGTAIGTAAVVGASRRYPSFRALTLPFRAFLVTSSATFIAVIAADRASARFDIENNPEKKAEIERERSRAALLEQNKTALERAKEWATEYRYPLLFGFWVASMAGSWTLVNRNPYLSGSQKLVQARMYAQGGTLAALLASFAIEGADVAKGRGRWETIKVLDPNDPTHQHIIEKKIHHERYAGEDQWREMVEAEEERLKERNSHIEAKRDHPDNKEKRDQAQKDKKEEKDRTGAKS